MTINIGTKDLKDCYLGTSKVKEIYVGASKVYPSIINFATQGPCPDGFHVPTKDDWVEIYNKGISLGAWTNKGGGNMKNYLKLPPAGKRNGGYANAIEGQGSDLSYWSCNEYTKSQYGSSFAILLWDGQICYQTGAQKPTGYPIRAFKNEPTIPDSSWTVLYQGSGSSGIFCSQNKGLISISSDGTNWITIADKNVGATTAWNNGDTVNENNCGGYFQWGNNYMFPFTGDVTADASRVNVSTYGPGNYYSSNVFIYRYSSPYDWANPSNNNLRGGVDGNVPV